MKFNYDNKKVIVNISHKAGLSTIINLLGYPLLNYMGSKKQVRIKLSEKGYDYSLNNFFEEAYLKVAIVRDPIERIISCYNDRIVKKNKNNLKDRIKSFTEFYNNFEDLYKNEYQIKIHSYPQVEDLGKNLNYYDLIVNTKNINTEFKPKLEKLTNTKIPSAVLNVSHSHAAGITLTKEQEEYFKDFYKEDYKYYGKYFYDSK